MIKPIQTDIILLLNIRDKPTRIREKRTNKKFNSGLKLVKLQVYAYILY
jgi:hypothetical protein